ncbi:hypothetical protein BB561_002723 [Smittium simulii]|uniref:Polyadenylation factor subunit 2 n=1 Tax=Smittium simulii TaxID=133385 RepID=A0A2T9YPG4_9FUNG|nr:hypothetical protein BB561_002723 [Smittium simulii]
MQNIKQPDYKERNIREPNEQFADPNRKDFFDAKLDSNFDGKRMRKTLHRRTIDYYGSIAHGMELRMLQTNFKRRFMKADPSYIIDLLVPLIDKNDSTVGIASRFVQQAQNKIRCPWTPEGRRILTGSSSGEFTLWNGLTFNFETIMQAHDTAIRGMEWSHDSQWLISGDQGGVVKYWQPNMNNVKIIQAHKEAIRDLSFSPSDTKFASASDDSTLKIWDFTQGHEETTLNDWHPSLGLIASGSKDNMIKLWDPRSRQCLNTLHGHNNTILGLKWNKNGWWLLSGSRDSNLQVFDIRKMDNFINFKGITKEVTSVAWHPIYETALASGCSDGSLMMWNTNNSDSVYTIQDAHESYVWSIDWHPVGHLLASGSNDHTTRFWARSRPGDYLKQTQLGIVPPLPPGATNASSLLHDSSAASVMQGHYHRSTEQDKIFESQPKLDISDLLKAKSIPEAHKKSTPGFLNPQIANNIKNQHDMNTLNSQDSPNFNNFQSSSSNLQTINLPGLGNGITYNKSANDNVGSLKQIENRNDYHNANKPLYQINNNNVPSIQQKNTGNQTQTFNRQSIPQHVSQNNYNQRYNDNNFLHNIDYESKNIQNNNMIPYNMNQKNMIYSTNNTKNDQDNIPYKKKFVNDKYNTFKNTNTNKSANSFYQEDPNNQNQFKKYKTSH